MKHLLFLLCIFSITCQSVAYQKRAPKNEKKAQPVMYRKKKSYGILCNLKVDGIECGLCAQSIINILNKCAGVEEAIFKNVGLDYNASIVEFFWTKKSENIPFNELQQKIEKEGFEFAFLEGVFYGTIELKEGDGNPIMLLNSLHIPVTLKNVPEKLLKKKEIVLTGKISYEKKHGYIFTFS